MGADPTGKVPNFVNWHNVPKIGTRVHKYYFKLYAENQPNWLISFQPGGLPAGAKLKFLFKLVQRSKNLYTSQYAAFNPVI